MKNIITLLCLLLSFFIPKLFAQGSENNALQLDGNGAFAWVPDNSALDPTNQLTVEAWVYSDRYDYNSWQEFVMKGGNSSSTPRQYFIRPYEGSGRLEFAFHDSNNDLHNQKSNDTLVNGNWYHVAGVYDGEYMRVYINGVLEGEDDEGAFTIQQSSGMLAFGRLGDIDAEYLDGKIDEVRIWNVARTQTQIVSTMNKTLGPEYYSSADSGLVGYWRFDVLENLGVNSDSTDDVRDLTIYGNHADLENGAILVPTGALVSVKNDKGSIPENFILNQNYPNPFNPSTTISWQSEKDGRQTLKIYDVLGNEVAILFDRILHAGKHEITFDASSLPSGVYFYRIRSGNFIKTKKMVLLK